MAQGIPVLRGPYVVEYTNIPTIGAKIDLWTPAVGDVLLRLFCDWQSVIPFDHGAQLWIGPNVDGVAGIDSIVAVDGTVISRSASSPLDLGANVTGSATGYDHGSSPWYSSAYVFHSTDPVQIQLAATDGTDPSVGHVELYALVARALPVS